MAKTKRQNGGDFDAILSGFAQQPSKKAPAYQARRPAPPAQSKPISGAPRSENPVRRLFKNISFPWPTKISGFMGNPGRWPQDAYDETVAETKPAPRVDSPQSETPQATKINPPKPQKTEDEAIAEELGTSELSILSAFAAISRRRTIPTDSNPQSAAVRNGACQLPICSSMN